jgi:hypothetical protein
MLYLNVNVSGAAAGNGSFDIDDFNTRTALGHDALERRGLDFNLFGGSPKAGPSPYPHAARRALRQRSVVAEWRVLLPPRR